MTLDEEFRFIASVWNDLSLPQKEDVADLYVKNRDRLGDFTSHDRANYIAAMKPALQAFGHIPPDQPLFSTDNGAEEYNEIMQAQELIHGT